MAEARLGRISLIIIAVLLISACGTGLKGQQEKIAVVQWQRAVAGHTDYRKLEQGEKILRDLLEKRKLQADLAEAQINGVNRLRQLRRLSQQGYLTADMNTRMAEQRERENVLLEKFVKAAEAEADEQLGPRRKAVEDSYQLQIFNLRAALGSVRMRPDERKELEQELSKAQRERGSKIRELEMEKQAYVDAKVQPYLQELRARMDALAQQYGSEIRQQMNSSEDKDRELLRSAPQALHNALNIMDREIEKQQNKNDQLRQQINKDIESSTVKLAKERGYTIVFNQIKVNVSADDITDAVLSDIKKKK